MKMDTPWMEISASNETYMTSTQANKFMEIDLRILKKSDSGRSSILVTRQFQEFKVVNSHNFDHS